LLTDGGYSLNIGAMYQSVMTRPAPYFFSDDFYALLATQFVWGSVLGGDSLNNWEASIYFSNSSNEATRSYTAALASQRLEWAPYLVHGRLMRSPQLLNSSLPLARLARPVADPADPSVMTACSIEQPAMQLWQANATSSSAASASLGLTVVNYARTPVTFSVGMDVSSLVVADGSSSGELFWGVVGVDAFDTTAGQTVLVRSHADEEWVGHTVKNGVLTLQKTLPALTAALIEVADPSQVP